MTNNRKPVDEVRLSWDAKAAFKRMNRADKLSIREPHERGHAYAPPSNIGPERLTQLRKYEPPAKHGRDIGSLMRYHAAHKKGRTDDDCLREKFGSGEGGRKSVGDVSSAKSLDRPAAPTPPQSADGPWPKCLTSNDGTGVIVYTGERDEGTFYGERARKWKFRKRYADALAEQPLWSLKQRFALPLADAIAKLEQNGHKDAAAQLRSKAINSY